MSEFSEMLQIKIRETGQTNKEFAKSSGIKKKDLDTIFMDVAPSKWVLGRICKALGWDYEPEPTKQIQLLARKIVHANFKEKKPKSPLKAKGRFCIRCFFNEQIYVYDTVEMAHYTGIRQHAFGKSRGKKLPDILKCPLCKDCHKHFDEPKESKSVELSEDFLFYIDLFIAQEFEAGNIIIKNPGV